MSDATNAPAADADAGLNAIQKIAKRRLQAIADNTARIVRKMAQHPARQADYQQRLDEYALSAKALKLELAHGVACKINDPKVRMLLSAVNGDIDPALIPKTSGTVVNVPVGALALEGKK